MNRNPQLALRAAASRPARRRNRYAGHRIASGHQSNGAKASDSARRSAAVPARWRTARREVLQHQERNFTSSFGTMSRGVITRSSVEAAAVGTQHLEFEAAEHEGFAAARQPAQEVDDQAADGVELLVAEVGAEVAVEFVDARLRLDGELALAFLADVEIVIDVVLIADVADDLLEHVFDGDQARTRRRTRRPRWPCGDG